MRQLASIKSGQVVRFVIAGGVGILIYCASLYVLTEFVETWYMLSAVIAFLIYWGVSFPVQKYWVFENMEKEYIKQQLLQYSIVSILNWVINTSLMYALVEYLSFWYFGVQLILTVIASIIAFFVFMWIFRHSHS